MSDEQAGELSTLQEIVVAHHVYYDVLPEEWIGREVQLKVGFELKLWGAHLRGTAAIPGCEKCQCIFDDFRKVAAWIMPKEERASRYEIEMFDHRLYASPSNLDTDEVGLTLKILHRDRGDLPVDACEERCLHDMRAKLRELGVHEGRWSAMPGAAADR